MKNNFTSLAFLASVMMMLLFNSYVSGQSTPGTFPSNKPISSVNQSDAPNVGGLVQIYSSTGLYTLSADGIGSIASSMNIRVNKPTASATVQKAILMTAVTMNTVGTGCITLAGSSVTWNGTVAANFFNNYWSDVTSIVAPVIDAQSAGISTLAITECNTSYTDGHALLVVFNDATATEKTVIVMWGGQNTAGDNFSVTLAQPIDPSATGALMDMGLGIGFSYQLNGSQQYSRVDINSQRLTSAAGGEDDGASADGALITVGGIGDVNSNPADPNAAPTNPLSDDELYNVLPFITNTTTSLTISTLNPSNDDNVFLAYFALSGAAIIGEGILLSQTSSTGVIGTSHTSKAKVLNSLGQPVTNRAVTFDVISGPNTGSTYTANTDVNGEVFFTYTGSGGVGTDNIKACFTNSQSQVLCSNTLVFDWTAPPCTNPTSAGTIGNAQSSSSSFNPTAITSLTLPTGHTGTLEYKWQQSIVSSTSDYIDIANSNAATYDPGLLTQTTWFRRIARVDCMNNWTGAPVSNPVEMTVGTSIVTPWDECAIGSSNGLASSAGPGLFELSSTGYSSPNTDVQEFVYQNITGDGSIVARVASITGGGWAGVEIRESCAPGSKKVALKTQLQPLIRSEIRQTTNGGHITSQILRQGIKWLKMERLGNRFNAYTSVDGSSWRSAFSTTLTMSTCVEIGIFSESKNFSTTTVANFTNVAVTGSQCQVARSAFAETEGTDSKPTNVVEIYPNPASNYVNIVIPGNTAKIQLAVFSSDNKLVYSENLQGSSSLLDVSSLKPGIYILRFAIGSDITTKRLVVM